MDKEKHKIGNCPYYKEWIRTNQRKDLMHNASKDQICPNCKKASEVIQKALKTPNNK